MTSISSVSSSYYPPSVTTLPAQTPAAQPPANQTGSGIQSVQNSQKISPQAKDVAETVYISNLAQKNLDIYLQVSSGNSTSNTGSTVTPADVYKADQKINQRQSIQALAQYQQVQNTNGQNHSELTGTQPLNITA